MPLDQEIAYKVRIDDSDFQAKLSSMRASVDTMMGSSMSSMSGMPMGGVGMSMNQIMGNMGMMQQPGTASGMYGPGGMGGIADFGLSVRPITYTPPAIAMQPHFGMFQIQQSLGQAIRGSMQPFSFGNIPSNISATDYSAYSARQVGDSVQDFTTAAMTTAFSMGATEVGMAAGAAVGQAMIPIPIVGGLVGAGVGAVMAQTPVGDLAVQNTAMQRALAAGSFRFVTSGADRDPLTGRGLNRGARQEVASGIQHMEMNDLRYNGSDMQQILEVSMQNNLFSGVRGTAASITERFGNIRDTMKVVETTLNASKPESAEAMAGMQSAGITLGKEQIKYVQEQAFYAQGAGRTPMEMMALSQAGIEQFRGTGVRMSLGGEAMGFMLRQNRELLSSGAISQEMIGQAGGEQAMAQQGVAGMLAATQTAYGRAFMMANYDPVTKGLKSGAAEGAAGFNLNSAIGQLGSMTPAGMLAFQANQQEMVSSMTPAQLQTLTMGSTAAAARMIGSAVGGKFEDNYIVAGERMGRNYEELKKEMAMAKQDPKERDQAAREDLAREVKTVSEEGMRDRTNVGKAVSNFMSRNIWNPIAESIENKATAAGSWAENLTQSMKSGLSNLSSEAMGQGTVVKTDFTAESAARGEAAIKAKRGVTSGSTVVDLTEKDSLEFGRSKGALMMAQVKAAGGATLTGDQVEKSERDAGVQKEIQYNGTQLQEFASKEQADKYLSTHGGGSILQSDPDGRRVTVMTNKALEAANKYAYDRELSSKDKEAGHETVEKIMKNDKSLGNVLALGSEASADDLVKAMGMKGNFDSLKGSARAAVMEMAANKDLHLDAANKQILGKSDNSATLAVQRSGIAANAEDRNALEKSAREMIDDKAEKTGWFGMHSTVRTLGDLSGDQLGAMSAYMKVADSGGNLQNAKADLFRHFGKQTDEVQAYASILQGDARKKFEATVDKIDMTAANAKEISGGAATGEVGAGMPVLGASKDAGQAILAVSNQMLENMKLMQSIHDQIVASEGRR